MPTLLLDFEVVDPMARRVADARLLFDALRGPEDGDRQSLAAAAARCGQRPSAGAARAVCAHPEPGAGRPEIATQCAAACAHLTSGPHGAHRRTVPAAGRHQPPLDAGRANRPGEPV
ncbi:MAG: hypothetical protein R3E42_00230 [Burkholderiaceae bacterium]